VREKEAGLLGKFSRHSVSAKNYGVGLTFGSSVLHLSGSDSLIVTLCVGASNLFWLPIMVPSPTASAAARYCSVARS